MDSKNLDVSTKNEHTINASSDLNKINSLKSENKSEIVAHYTKDEESVMVDRVTFEGLEDDSICSDDINNKKLPQIPDGGWGWVVVVAAFLISACADGLAFSFGLLHEEFTSYFETTQSKTSLIGSLFIATPLLAGPIMSALVDRYGCRTMTMIAGLLSTIGFLLASISNSVEMLCLTFGFLSGLAMGILYVTAVVAVAFWFDKRRNLAVSLASCGIGFGTLIYSPLTHYLLEAYDWRNTVVLLAGTLLNMCVCGALMRDPEWLTIKQERERRLSKPKSGRSSSIGSMSSRSIGGESLFLTPEELKALLKSGQSPDYILATLTTSIAEAQKLEETTQFNAEQSYKRIHSDIHLPTFIAQNEKVPVEVIEKLMSNKRLYNIILQNYPDLITRRRSEENLNLEVLELVKNEPAQLPVSVTIKMPNKNELETNKDEKNKERKEKLKNQKSIDKDVNIENSVDKKIKPKLPVQQTNWLSRQISMDHHYLRDMPLYRNTIMHRGAMMNIPRYKLRASSLPDIYRNSMWSLGSESDDGMKWYQRLWQTTKSTFDFRMFTEFHFLMFNLSSLILSVWFIVPYFFLKSYMTSRSMAGGAEMISIIGIASSIGIVALGWAGDQPWINVTKTYAVCLIICGLSVSLYPLFITNYWGLAIISAVFGLSFASSYSYTPAILMELMPIDHFTVAYGLILLSQGIGHLVGPPIGGMLYDLTGSWDLTFYTGGIWLVISGLCVGVIPYTKDLRMCGTAPLFKEAEEARKEDADV
ncbi:Monocarboxylate transporter 12 [Papilio xuthus]|uniref:Monocarboxylate transporter 12 n=1 Tax=Papilio xuthus TaxID=66420 RepID=A0A194QG55_PAPXU|nr:Monocarboxylate transporter 12 [Papilio xuthus]